MILDLCFPRLFFFTYPHTLQHITHPQPHPLLPPPITTTTTTLLLQMIPTREKGSTMSAAACTTTPTTYSSMHRAIPILDDLMYAPDWRLHDFSHHHHLLHDPIRPYLVARAIVIMLMMMM